MATTKATMTKAQNKYMKKALASKSCAMGVLAPNRKSMQGKAKKGKVTRKTSSMGHIVPWNLGPVCPPLPAMIHELAEFARQFGFPYFYACPPPLLV